MSSNRETELLAEIDRLRKALEAIRTSPGGGPGRRIATQALGLAETETMRIMIGMCEVEVPVDAFQDAKVINS